MTCSRDSAAMNLWSYCRKHPAKKVPGVAEKLRQSIEFTEFMAKGRHIPVTITMGVTEVKDDDNGIEPIFTRADYALLQAKQAGRNRVEVV